MNIQYTLDGDNVKREALVDGEPVETAYFARTKVESVRVDNLTVQELIFEFNMESCQFVLVSEDSREEPFPPNEIELLKAENASLRADLNDLTLMMADLIAG